VLVIDDWAMAPLAETERRRLLGDLRGSLFPPAAAAD
jgi:hypothetical protein